MSSVTSKSAMLFGRSNVGSLRCSLSTVLVVLAIVCTFFATFTCGAQKFVPNGRYGRRSDLPPLEANQIADTERTPTDQSFLRQSISMDDFSPLGCIIVDSKTNTFKCFERYSLSRFLKRKSQQIDIGGSSLSSSQGQYQDQS